MPTPGRPHAWDHSMDGPRARAWKIHFESRHSCVPTRLIAMPSGCSMKKWSQAVIRSRNPLQLSSTMEAASKLFGSRKLIPSVRKAVNS
jgi:hypothetical protein